MEIRRFNDLIRYLWSEVNQNGIHFSSHQTGFTSLESHFVRVAIKKVKPRNGNHFLWSPNVLESIFMFKIFVPLFKDSHLVCCVIESFHNLLLTILNSIVVKRILEDNKQAGLFTHNEMHTLGYNCPIKSNQWPHI